MGALGAIPISQIMPVLQSALAAQPQQPTDPSQQTAPVAPAGALSPVSSAAPVTAPKSLVQDPNAPTIKDASDVHGNHAAGKAQYLKDLHELESERDALDLAHKNKGFGMMDLTPAQWEEKKGMVDARIQDFKNNHPWGADVSAHPGVLGKILHGLSVAGQTAAMATGPGAVAEDLIPGSL